MIRLVAAKQKIGIPANNEIALVLKSKRSFKMGINGLITTRPARIFNEAKKMGVPVLSLFFIFDLSSFGEN
jgi:glycerol-3-phosphate responsive antiterminator